MKNPRSTIAKWVLIATGVFAAGASGWLWALWPDRTFAEFVLVIRRGDFSQSSTMFAKQSSWKSEERGILKTEILGSVTTLAGADARVNFEVVHRPSELAGDGPWLHLDRGGAEDFVLPKHVWQAWFDTRLVRVEPRSFQDFVCGQRRFTVVDGNLRLRTRHGVVECIEVAPVSEFFRRRLVPRSYDGSEVRWSASAIIEKFVSPEDELTLLGPQN